MLNYLTKFPKLHAGGQVQKQCGLIIPVTIWTMGMYRIWLDQLKCQTVHKLDGEKIAAQSNLVHLHVNLTLRLTELG